MNIILIHGQGRTPLAMLILGWRLSRKQHRVRYFGYACAWQTFDSIKRRFVETIRHKIGQQPYAIVAHSLGGIIVRASLPHLVERPPQHLVMLAPPNQPPQIAKKMKLNPVYRWLTGDCGQKLADDAFYQKLPRPTVPTTIIAGVKGLPGKLSLFGEEANDGVLAVKETELGQEFKVILTPAIHPFIMNSRQVASIVSEVVIDN